MTTQQQRMEIVKEIASLVASKHVDPANLHADYSGWSRDLLSKAQVFSQGTDAHFESGLSVTLAELGTSHLSLLLPGSSGIPPTFALNTGLMAVGEDSTRNWMFRDVVDSGPAHRAGIRDGELLLAIDGQAVRPPDPVLFTLGRQYTLTLGKYGGGEERSVRVDLPMGGAKGRPAGIEPKAVTFKELGKGIGHLRVSYFPGAIGYGFIKDLNSAIEQLTAAGVKRFVLDLRGNPGGGLGSLRVMSLLSPEPTPIGYSLTRKAIQKGWKRDQLPRIDHIPVGKWQQIMMAVRFKVLNRDRSVALVTEKLGRSVLVGNTVVLANSQTRSAAEMIVAFVKEHRLAPIVGDKTPGEVLGAVNFRLSHGYKLRMPIATWQTWAGTAIEGVGVTPDIAVPLRPAELGNGIDTQIAEAASVLRGAGAVSS